MTKPNFELLYLQSELRVGRTTRALQKIVELVHKLDAPDASEIRLVAQEALAGPDPSVRTDFDDLTSRALFDAVMQTEPESPDVMTARYGSLTIVASPIVPRDLVLVSDGEDVRSFKLVPIESEGTEPEKSRAHWCEGCD